jgi:formylglycine-generating enzyme required for sulfatase activity
MVLHGETEFLSLVGKIYQRSGEPALPKWEYWLAHCEVTRGQFEEFMQDPNYNFEKPTDFKGVDTNVSPTADHPAQNVSWYDAVMYCNWLSRREGKSPVYRKTGKKEKVGSSKNQEFDQWELVPSATGYRLLLEVEWEYAARAGSVTDWSSGSDERLLADYCQMYPSKLSAEGGHKLPNAWGLHDIHGNVWEWCYDLYDGLGSSRVARGGSWFLEVGSCQSASRVKYMGDRFNDLYGFRVAQSSLGIPK